WSWDSSGWSEGDRQALQPAQRVVVAALRLVAHRDRADFAGERGQHRLAFEARDELADAHVDAGAEADMAGDLSGDVIAVRPLPAARVAVGRAQEHQHLLPFGDHDTAEFDIARRGAEEGLHRTFEAHRLLERVAGQRR